MWKQYINRHCRSLLTVLVTLWLVAGCAATQESRLAAQPETPTPAVEESYRQALDMMQASQWPEARQRLEDLTAAHPGLAGPWLNLGIVYTRLGEPEAAGRQGLQEIGKLRPADRDAAAMGLSFFDLRLCLEALLLQEWREDLHALLGLVAFPASANHQS